MSRDSKRRNHMRSAQQKRIWIATPYFVPDESMMTALQVAVMRGVF